MEFVIATTKLSHSYAKRQALCDITLQIPPHTFFAILGPNGGGKTTLFKILSTLIKPQQGEVSVGGYNVATQGDSVRNILGVVFQNASLDPKLKVFENLLHQGHLYGLYGKALRTRIDFVLEKLGILERKNDLVETLSGGLQRRAELARSLLHHPKILLLDEPTTGLDPAARIEFWKFIRQISEEENTSIIYTTHLFEEAERGDTLAILDSGKLVALDSPDTLKSEMGGDIISLKAKNTQQIANKLKENFGLNPTVRENLVRIEDVSDLEVFSKIASEFRGEIDSITYSRPDLEDVFVRKTGKNFIYRKN